MIEPQNNHNQNLLGLYVTAIFYPKKKLYKCVIRSKPEIENKTKKIEKESDNSRLLVPRLM